MTTGSSEWRTQQIDSIRKRMMEAALLRPGPDEFALLRELCRLHGGRLALHAGELQRYTAQHDLIERFGIVANADGVSISLSIDRTLGSRLPEFAHATVLDEKDRNSSEYPVADAFLARLSKFERYRSPAQKHTLRALALAPAGSILLASLPTGGGKSLIFQMFARLARSERPNACILVIVPTIALALDHEQALRAMPDLDRSRALTSQLDHDAQEKLLDDFRKGDIPILLLSPETFVKHFEQFQAAADPRHRKALLPGQLVGVVVDEAHIIAEWGRSFRPDFQRLDGFIQTLITINPALRTILLSATLPPDIRNDLKSRYEKIGPIISINASQPRYEFDIIAKRFEEASDRDRVLDLLIDHAPRPAIIYATEVDHVERLERHFRQDRGYRRIASFTGATTGPDRQAIIEKWRNNQIDLIVATSAFGMGIDKADVRCVIHACLPESINRYYQEMGRAGRDSHQALSVIMWTGSNDDKSDEKLARRLVDQGRLTRDVAEKRWHALITNPMANLHFSPEGKRQFTANLHAWHQGIQSPESDNNRDWNENLLMLLQRCGIITTLGISDGTKPPTWTVQIENEAILSGAINDQDDVWRDYERRRDREVQVARKSVDGLISLLKDQRHCILLGAFEAIDPMLGPYPTCGRCSACRRLGNTPARSLARPLLSFQDWLYPPNQLTRSPWPVGLHIIEGTYGQTVRHRKALVSVLAAQGFDHWIVPSMDAADWSAIVTEMASGLGLVSTWDDDDLDIARLVPSVFVAPREHETSDWLDAMRRICGASASLPYLVIAPSGQMMQGKRLATFTPHPAISLDVILSPNADVEERN